MQLRKQPTLSVHEESPAEVEEVLDTARHPSGKEEEEEDVSLRLQEAEAYWTVTIP